MRKTQNVFITRKLLSSIIYLRFAFYISKDN